MHVTIDNARLQDLAGKIVFRLGLTDNLRSHFGNFSVLNGNIKDAVSAV